MGAGSVRPMRTRRWILAAVAAAILVALVALTGCGGDDDSGKSSGGGSGGSGGSGAAKVYGPGDAISVVEGQTFVIELEANPTTGYEWTAEANANAELVKSAQIADDTTMVGAPGMQQLTFRATKAGSSTLVLNYARSFEPNNPPAQTEKFPLTVE